MKKICFLTLIISQFSTPAYAQRWNGWFYNNTNQTVAVQRIHLKCWDPQQIAYKLVKPHSLWNFGSSTTSCISDWQWIQAKIMRTDTKQSIGRFSLNNKATHERGHGGTACYVELTNNENKYSSGTDFLGCGSYGTVSFTIQLNKLETSKLNTVNWGLNPE